MVEEHFDDLVHVFGRVSVDAAESIDETPSADRAKQLALSEAPLVQPGFGGRLHLHMKGKRAVLRRQRDDEHQRESGAESVGRTEYKSRSSEGGFTGVWFAEIDQPHLINRCHQRPKRLLLQ